MILKIFTAIIATRGNAIIAAISQWNTLHNKRIQHHPTCVPLVKIAQASSDNTYLYNQFCNIWRYCAIYCICDIIEM